MVLCFLRPSAGTATKNLFEAYSQLSESKLQLSNFQGNVLHFTNAIRTPIRRLLRANESPSFQHFPYVFHGVMDAPYDEFCTFVINLYTDYRKGGPTCSLSMLELLDQLDTEYNRIFNLGRWTKKQDNHVLAFTATISTLQIQLSSLRNQYSSLQAFIAQKTTPTNPPTAGTGILQKPLPLKPEDSEITEFQGFVWKWFNKCFNGSWNHTHVTSELVAGVGKCNRHHQDISDANSNNNNGANTPSPSANIATTPSSALVQPTPSLPANSTPSPSITQANIAVTSSSALDFLD
jgi:hypothetical protein